jgi:carbamoyltransferase
MTSTVRARGGVAGSPVPAALHVDGTARVQEVHADALPLYASLLSAVGAHTGHPCVVNTSFNLAGEPIVSTPADGWATFLRSGIDALAVGPLLITREPPA